jgi:hypothetical protein
MPSFGLALTTMNSDWKKIHTDRRSLEFMRMHVVLLAKE